MMDKAVHDDMTQMTERNWKTIGAVITAAGTGARGGAEQALTKIRGMSLAEYIVVNFQRAGVKDLVLVTGNQNDEFKKQLKGFGVTFLSNEDSKRTEMLDSVKLGLDYLKERCEKVFVCPVDVPFFSMETVERLLKVDAAVVIPSYQYRGGHPVMLDQKIFSDILNYKGEDGLRGAIKSLHQKPIYIEIEDRGTVEPVQEGKVKEPVAEEHHRKLDRAQVKVRLAHTKPYFGPGTVTLLRQIQSLGAVREASEKTGISYSKAWNMIRTAEEESGLELVRRQPGGKSGGTAAVTEEGLKLIRKYEELEKLVERFAEEEYRRIFGIDDRRN